MLVAMRLEHVLELLRGLAPESLAEPWDRVGLQVGDPTWPVRRAMLCIDLTDAVLAEAQLQRVDLVVAYHPPIFHPLSALTAGDPKQRLILAAARARLAIYSPHTALDAAPEGVNDWLCAAVGAGEATAIRPARSGGGCDLKLVTFVPPEAVAPVRDAMAVAGAGRIGAYERCSFGLDGEGTFHGGRGTSPAVGRRGRLETVAERRLEMACPVGALDRVVAALRAVHPYEEPAFDIYRLEPPPDASRAGQGRRVTLARAVPLATLARRVRRHLGGVKLDVAAPPKSRQVRTVGLCAGAGGSLLSEAGAVDAFITGEMRHHDVLAASQAGTAVLLAGHTQTERPYLRVYRERLRRAGGRDVAWLLSRRDRPPERRA